MFAFLSRTVHRFWLVLLLGWLCVLVGLKLTAPQWNTVATEGELRHLPAQMPTREGTRLYRQAFPQDITNSTVVLVLRRSGGLLQQDWDFIREQLVPELKKTLEQFGGLIYEQPVLQLLPEEVRTLVQKVKQKGMENIDSKDLLSMVRSEDQATMKLPQEPRVVAIHTFEEPALGPLLISTDGEATLVVLGLTSEFLDARNQKIVGAIQSLLDRLRKQVPADLKIHLTGSAGVGSDILDAIQQSTQAVQQWAIWLVIALLIVVFRAPIAALIPLATMYLAVEIALGILAWGAYLQIVEVFNGLELYLTVIVYGAGIDYSMFLISRHQEELRQSRSVLESATISIEHTGMAIAASAGTEIVGIGLLCFTQFGKFQQAGLGVALGLVVLLIASLTFTPSLLRLAGRWAFWPQPVGQVRSETQLGARVFRWFSLDRTSQRFWRTLGEWQRRHPLLCWSGVLLLMAPLALFGLFNLSNLTYGLDSGLPPDAPSARGLEVLRKHFSTGVIGPVTVLIEKKDFDFSSPEGIRQIEILTQRLRQRQEELAIADIRSLANPLGRSRRADEIRTTLQLLFPKVSFLKKDKLIVADTSGMSLAEKAVQQALRLLVYVRHVSNTPEHDGDVTRMSLFLTTDPFARESIARLDEVERAIQEEMPEKLSGASYYLLGATAGLRDVRTVAQADRQWIMWVVPIGVGLVLIVLLRRVVVSVYLILTVLLSFFVTLGTTYALFWCLDPAGFQGLDWTVPIFLYTLLVAVGEDYNVLLVSRVQEEEKEHGSGEGITEALAKTGSLISGAGLIMSGTFLALALGGKMTSMHQLGFALSFGVLLDTFVVRPVLVPSFLQLQARWKSLGQKRDQAGGRETEPPSRRS